ncbi:MAG: BREX-1 system phosphatase PglZ type B [Lewinellaceae bacterium]|nr:BREX-1 system phosphatase PglZ type B [Saprospiraceae bacterium]MCB9337188.1 BREX-1 system phosphatase PglZ type B [Lewinellaceae bacterium]
MNYSLKDKVVENLKKAAQHNSQIMVRPEVILWPDPERQFEQVIPALQRTFPALLIFGAFQPEKKQGPAIWLKCMVARTLPEAEWPEKTIPIIYLPGMSKGDFRNIAVAGLDVQPLMEYQYSGTLFTQVNGREWTVLAFMENEQAGLGLNVAQDSATKEYLVKVLPNVFEDKDVHFPQTIVDANFLQSLLFPDTIPSVLQWLCKGDDFMKNLSPEQAEAFRSICKSRYSFEPDARNQVDVAQKLGSQRNDWKQVWQYYANAPHKFPDIEPLLRLAKPDDLGTGVFTVPEESWPQVNEQKEEELRKELKAVAKLQVKEALKKLESLKRKHQERLRWVWSERGQSPLATALTHLLAMTEVAAEPFPATSIAELKEYYTGKGYLADQAMRWALASVKSEKDRETVIGVISTIYRPWLENVTLKFQTLIKEDASVFTNQQAQPETENFVLFVDAFRFELAIEFSKRLIRNGYKVEMETGWSAIPSLTPTAKPNVSPIASAVAKRSEIKDFRPQLKSDKDLQTANFRAALAEHGFEFIPNGSGIDQGKRQWQEIGEIDTKGHSEQAGMVRRIEELFEQVKEAIDAAFEKGVRRIKIVTDHGWLLLPGGLPKEELNKNLTENRWGRCALIKEGAQVDLLHLPWRWNPGVYIAYAPGISFFRKNDEYAHGGVSLHECLVPTLFIENTNAMQVTARFAEVKWINLTCKIETTGAPDGYQVDIRTKYSDPASSIVLLPGKTLKDNKLTLMVDDDAEGQSATLVLMDEQGTILNKRPTVVGG